MTTKSNHERKGQVGIGTIIVFIALVGVAALAAGLLLNTAEGAQEQGEQTFDQSLDEVSNKLVNYQSYFVTDTSSGDNITDVEFKVRKQGGSEELDLNKATIEYTANGEQASLGSANFSASTTSGSDTLLSDQEERGEIALDLTSISELGELSPEDRVEATIITDTGAETDIKIQVPDNPEADSTVRAE